MAIKTSMRSVVEPFHAMDILAQANRLKRQGHSVISMAVGQPSDPAPKTVLEAARRALMDGRIGYTDALGILALRETIAKHYADHYNVNISPDRVVVTTGSSASFNLAFLSLFDVGDRVAISAPGYPAYRNILGALGIEAVEIDLAGAAYLTEDHIRQIHQNAPLNGLLFASPANPTGATIPAEAIRRLVETCQELGIQVMSDEIYHRLNYVGDDVTALTVSDDVVVINSFSKFYCMTGWRIGWMVLPAPIVRTIESIQQSLYISAPDLSQRAALAAFDATDELELVKRRYAENREFLLQRLPQLGFRLAAPPDGAFYAYCDVSALTNDSMTFVQRMLAECFVAATPGRDFDPLGGHQTVRLSYAGSPQEMREATDRIQNWLR